MASADAPSGPTHGALPMGLGVALVDYLMKDAMAGFSIIFTLSRSIRPSPLALAALHFSTTRDDAVRQLRWPLRPPAGPAATAERRPIYADAYVGRWWRVTTRGLDGIGGNHGDDGRPWWLCVCENTRCTIR